MGDTLPLIKLYFEVFDYFSSFSHLLRTFVCDLCLIWWWGVTYSLCSSIFIYLSCVTIPEIDTLNKNGEMGSKSTVLLDQG